MSETPHVEVNGAAIRTIRKLAGVEIRDLATRIGITSSYLSRIETGSRRRLRPSVYAALRAALDVPDKTLLIEEEETSEGDTRT